jgi:sigma-B regulation protein RsbU (phosphoserine phosphatase)
MDHPQKLAEIHFHAKSDQLRRVRCEVRYVVGRRRCLSANIVDSVVLAVDEACTNIIRHAYGRECDTEIILEILQEGEELIFRLTDFADPVDDRAVTPRAIDHMNPGGLGMHIINQVMDKVAFVECPKGAGNVLEMRKKITPTGT